GGIGLVARGHAVIAENAAVRSRELVEERVVLEEHREARRRDRETTNQILRYLIEEIYVDQPDPRAWPGHRRAVRAAYRDPLLRHDLNAEQHVVIRREGLHLLPEIGSLECVDVLGRSYRGRAGIAGTWKEREVLEDRRIQRPLKGAFGITACDCLRI